MLMAPELKKHVASELKDKAAVQKELRKYHDVQEESKAEKKKKAEAQRKAEQERKRLADGG